MNLHPIKRHRFVSFVASKSAWTLGVLFLLGVAGLAIISSAINTYLGGDRSFWTFLDGIPTHALILVDVGSIPNSDKVSPWIWLFTGFFKIILIVVLLGIIVFKFLVLSDVFVARNTVSIVNVSGRTPKPEHEWELAIRIYNATKFEILDIHFDVYFRVPECDAGGSNKRVPNKRIKILPGREHWPIAIPSVPYTVNCALNADDVIKDKNGFRLVGIQGKSLSSPIEAGGNAFLVLIIRARTPELANEIVETHWFKVSGDKPQYSIGKFVEIEVEAGTEPKRAGKDPEKWKGWENFEMNKSE